MRNWTDDNGLSKKEKERNIIRYTVPKKNYQYEKITWDDYIRNKHDGYVNVRSSIIPVTVVNDEDYWLLGSFHDYPNYICSDFGGSCILKEGRERNKQAPFGCAITELHEESKGLLTQIILKSIGTTQKEDLQIYLGKATRPEEKLFFFFVPVNYEEVRPIIDLFNNTPDIDEKFGPLAFYHQDDILKKKVLTTHHLTDFINFLTS
jgi:hypothetical protein